MSNEWEDVYQRRTWGRWPNVRFVEWAMKTFRGQGPAEFLELGSGEGAQLRFLWDEGFKAMGIEISPTAAQRATEAYNMPTLVGDIRQLSYLAAEYDIGPFDCVFDVCTLQHLALDEATSVVRQAQKLLRPGGHIFSIMAKAGGEWGKGIPVPRMMQGRQLGVMFGPTGTLTYGVETLEGPAYGGERSHWVVDWQKPVV